MKWDKIDPLDSQWHTKTLQKAQEIQAAIEGNGKNLWSATLFDQEGTINIERILMIEGTSLYFVAMGLSTSIPVRKIQSLTKAHEVEKQMDGLSDLVSKETFLAEWSRRGSFKPKPGWGD